MTKFLVMPFSWGIETKNAFQSLKVSFTIAPFLIHVNTSKPFLLETNIFNFIVNVVLSQLGGNNLLHPINFYSCNFFHVEINYKIHDKKLLAIMDIFKEWHHLLEGIQHEIIMYLDHKNLQYFMKACVLIDIKFNGHCPYLDFSLSSHIASGANKGKFMCCSIVRALCLKKEMQPMNNNVKLFSSLKIFDDALLSHGVKPT
jgi:hypothetical protein